MVPLQPTVRRELFYPRSIIVISLSIALVTPALAAKKHYHYHHHYHLVVSHPAQPPTMGTMGPITSADYQQYLKNLHDAGYDP